MGDSGGMAKDCAAEDVVLKVRHDSEAYVDDLLAIADRVVVVAVVVVEMRHAESAAWRPPTDDRANEGGIA